MKINPRRKHHHLEGYLESDDDYIANNLAAAVALLDRAALPAPKGDVAELVADIDKHLKGRAASRYTSDELHCRSADALTALSARIAGLEAALREAEEAVATQNGVIISACKKTAALRTEMERIADLTERWKDSLVSQVNEIARAALKER